MVECTDTTSCLTCTDTTSWRVLIQLPDVYWYNFLMCTDTTSWHVLIQLADMQECRWTTSRCYASEFARDSLQKDTFEVGIACWRAVYTRKFSAIRCTDTTYWYNPQTTSIRVYWHNPDNEHKSLLTQPIDNERKSLLTQPIDNEHKSLLTQPIDNQHKTSKTTLHTCTCTLRDYHCWTLHGQW